MTVGELKARLEIFPDDYEIDFNGLEFYRLKKRGEKLVQMEFNQSVYRNKEGKLVIEEP